MRVLHISDLHLDKKDKRDYINHILKPLRATLEIEKSKKPFDFIFFCGDLLNQGGSSYGSIDEGFKDFDKFFIKNLLGILELDEDRFLFVPGNHDIVRDLDKKIIETGLTKSLVDYTSLKLFFEDTIGIDRVSSFIEFENNYYSRSSNRLASTQFYSVFNFEIDNQQVGVICFNSSWRCYDSKTDFEKLIFSEEKILEAKSYIENSDFKIFISHHHYKWCSKFEKEVVFETLKLNFDFFFCGHAHKSESKFCDDPDGKLFTFCAPGMLSPQIRNPKHKYENGIAVLDIDFENYIVSCKYFKAEHPKQKLIINSSIGDNGVWSREIPKGEKLKALIEKQELVSSILNDHMTNIDTHLLSYATDSQAPKKLDDIFVLPNIAIKEDHTDDGDDELLENLDEILKHKTNFIIYGTKESGKTIFLDKLFTESGKKFKGYEYIPIYIDFKNYNGSILKEIRKFLGVSNQKVLKIIKTEKIILLVDNISFEPEDEIRVKEIRSLIKDGANIKLVCSYFQLFEDDLPTNFNLLGLFEFKSLTLKQFKSKQIKILIKKWFAGKNDPDSNKKLETLTQAFLSLNLPRTPFAVSMFLWIIEKQENYTPLNNSTLVETFLEKLLNKKTLHEVKRETFGYDNKIWLISDIAKFMYKKDNPNYAIGYSKYVDFISTYLHRKKFDHYGVDKISKELLDEGVFTHEDNNVRFRFTCFFEFFLMKKMTIDNEFKEYVFQEKKYLKFINEIDYYTGINRGENELLNELLDRIEFVFRDLKDLIDKTTVEKEYVSHDDFFVEIDNKGQKKPSLISQLNEEKVLKFLPSNKPTEEDLELEQDEQLQLSGNEKGINKKEKSNKIKDLAKVLILVMKVLKNSEEIDLPDLKLRAYNIVLENSIYFAILHKAVFQLILSDSDKIPKERLDEFMLMNKHLPLAHQMFLKEHLGTSKLLSILKEKIDSDRLNPTSEFEQSLSIFLYSDLKGREYLEMIKEFIKTSRKNFIKDLIFFKLVTYYFYRSKTSSSDNYYLNMIADLLIISKGIKKSSKSRIMDDYKKKKNDKIN